MPFFNFHTHNKNEDYGIINCFPSELILTNAFISCGIHPWHYHNQAASDLEIIKKAASSGKLKAIGETGFDPASPVDISMQKEIFSEHVKISEIYSLPLIIHCVKYFHVLKELKLEFNPQQNWIIHGFNSKTTLLPDLIKAGFYFSISGKILKSPMKAKEFFKIVPIDRFFIETDDVDEDIKELYNFTASYLGQSVSEIDVQIENNLKNIKI